MQAHRLVRTLAQAEQTPTPPQHLLLLPYAAHQEEPTPTLTATATPTVTPTPTATPTPTSTPTRALGNQPPEFPNPMRTEVKTQFQYDSVGRLIGATTAITVSAAVDLDGDPITYTWSASNGAITGNGVTATWVRVISLGRPQPGTVVIKATDGHGGSDTFTIIFN